MKIKQVLMRVALVICGFFLFTGILTSCGTVLYNLVNWWENIKAALSVPMFLFMLCVTMFPLLILFLLIISSLFWIPMLCVKIFDIWKAKYLVREQ